MMGAAAYQRQWHEKSPRTRSVAYAKRFPGTFRRRQRILGYRPQDLGLDEWIEVYDSERKWVRSRQTLLDKDFWDPAYRVFEVNKRSGKLKSAYINSQLLPILMDRATSKPEKKKSLIDLQDEYLKTEIDKERVAIKNSQHFRKWIRDGKSGLPDRV